MPEMKSTRMEQTRCPKADQKARHHHERNPRMVHQQEQAEKEPSLMEAVRQRIQASRGRMTVFRIERIVQEEVIARGRKEMREKNRKPSTTGQCSTNAMLFEPVLCTQPIPEHGIFVDTSLTGSSKMTTVSPEADHHSIRGGGSWSPTKLMRTLACRMAAGRSTKSNKIHNVETL